jgi:DNA-binding response OmpR family regulator
MELVLTREGYQVVRAHNAEQALATVKDLMLDLIIIDLHLPDMDGVELCRTLRSMPNVGRTPTIFVTAQVESKSVVKALESGGDDYIRKPFAARELAARVKAHIRRSLFYSETTTCIMAFDAENYRVRVNDRWVDLTRVEYDLLQFLCASPYTLRTTEDLLTQVWHYPPGVGDAALVRNHIHNLRQKIELDSERPAILQSRHGRGYVVKAIIDEDESNSAHA